MTRSLSLILLGLTMLAFNATDAAEKPLKVFVLAGQSNMVGKRSVARQLPENLRQPQKTAFFFTGKDWVPLAPGKTEKRGFGPEISFAEHMAKSLGEPIGIIKHSIGGTSLAGDWSPARPNGLYAKLLGLVKAAQAKKPIQVVGMVWMQGGADAKSPAKAKAYKTNLTAFIKRARLDYGSKDMYFVCGRSAAPVKKYPNIKHVRAAQEGIALAGYSWVDCDNLPMSKDGVHYSTKGQVQSGHMFADAMLKLLAKK